MTAREYIYVPSDGTRERPLSAREASSQKIIEDNTTQVRMAGLLSQRGIEVPLWVVDGGYMIYGNNAQAQMVSRFAGHDLYPSSEQATQSVLEPANDGASVITNIFGSVAERIGVRMVTQNFNVAANDTDREVVYGKKPNVRGSYMQYNAA